MLYPTEMHITQIFINNNNKVDKSHCSRFSVYSYDYLIIHTFERHHHKYFILLGKYFGERGTYLPPGLHSYLSHYK